MISDCSLDTFLSHRHSARPSPPKSVLRALVDNTDASGTGTHHVNIRFMSPQRGKKTRSAASRYRRYVRLTSTPVELRLQLIKCQSKKEKERHAKRVIRAVGRSASTHTASPVTTVAPVGLTRNLACLNYQRPLYKVVHFG